MNPFDKTEPKTVNDQLISRFLTGKATPLKNRTMIKELYTMVLCITEDLNRLIKEFDQKRRR